VDADLEATLRSQSGVISRAQVLTNERAAHHLRRLIRRRELVRVHPGVYVNHTGELTWIQRAWAAVLAVSPSALTHESAIRAANGPGKRTTSDSGPIHVAIDRTRFAKAQSGVVIHQLADLDAKVLWNLGPPRVRPEQAVLDVAAEARTDFAAISTIADAVQARITTATKVLEALEGRSRIPRRAFLTAALRDVAEGACSLLEHGYLDRVERPHGLPRGQRQIGASSRGPIYRDVTYVEQGLVIELDGRLFHDSSEARDADLDRDLDAAVDRLQTVRIGWGQVYDRPCVTAQRIGALLTARGWVGLPTPCPGCSDTNSIGSVSLDDTDPMLSA